MRAVVTGATGFIGRRLVSKLAESGYTVLALGRGNVSPPDEWRRSGIDFRQMDVTNDPGLASALDGCDAVFHLAASMSNDWDTSYRVNVDGTKFLLDACARANVGTYVHASSVAVYSLKGLPRNSVIDEESPRHPADRSLGPYYHTKSLADDVVLDPAVAQGVRKTIVRPAMVVGPESTAYFQELGYRLPGGGLARVSSADRRLALVRVDDVAEAMLACVNRPEESPAVYNLVAEEPVTIKSYLAWCRQTKNFPRYSLRLPYALPWLAALVYEIAAGLGILPRGRISRAQIGWKQAPVTFSADRAREHLGWVGRSPISDRGSPVA